MLTKQQETFDCLKYNYKLEEKFTHHKMTALIPEKINKGKQEMNSKISSKKSN